MQSMSAEQLIQALDAKRTYYLGNRNQRLRRHPLVTITSSILGRITNRFCTNHPVDTSVRLFSEQIMDISIPPYLELLIAGAYVSHDPEVRLTKWLIRNLKEGMTFIDAGAHYGYYTVLAADRVGHTGKVIAIEPSTIVLPYTRRNVARQNNATLIEAGLSDTVGEATFYESDMQYSVISTMNPENLDQIDHLGGIAREITIATTTLDALNVKADIIKLDIEGAETAALRGGATMIQKNKPAIALEVFLRPTDNDRSAVEQLKHYGYSMYAITDTGLVEQIAYDDLDTYLAKRKAAYEAVCDDAIIDNLIFTI